MNIEGYTPPGAAKIPHEIGHVIAQTKRKYSHDKLESAIYAHLALALTQPFRDGNKRMSVFFTDIFLHFNGIELNVGWRKMYELAKFIVEKKESGENPEKLQYLIENIISQNV